MKERNILIVLLILITGIIAIAQEYPFQPYGLWRYWRNERLCGPDQYVFGVGDQNGDGYPDLLIQVAGWEYDTYMFYGGPDANAMIDQRYRWKLFPCGDVNGDEVIDFFTYPNGPPSILYGGQRDTIVDVTMDESQGAYDPIGDIDGDGLGDFLIYNNYRNDSLEVSIEDYKILFGGGNFDHWADWRIVEDSLDENPRMQPAKPMFGDMNGNGETDVFIQFYSALGEDNWDYECYVVHDFLTDTPETTNFLENFPDLNYTVSNYGRTFIPDINGDGCDELTLSWSNRNEYEFIWHFYLGGENPDIESDFEFPELQGGMHEANNIGDVNGDGWDDLALCMTVVRGSYWAYILLGGPEFDDTPEAIIVSPFEGVHYDNGLGASVKGIGDFNGNGYNDFLVLAEPDLSYMRAALVMALDEQFADVNESNGAYKAKDFTFYPPFPNPFNQHVEILFDLESRTSVDVNIFDINGNLVKSILRNNLFPGKHKVLWDGLDNHSFSVTAGLYFIRINTDDRQKTQPVVILK